MERRAFITAIAATPLAAADPTMGSTQPLENPTLMSLGETLEAATQDYLNASKSVDKICAKWSPQWPKPDERIVSFGFGTKPHRGIDGRGIVSKRLGEERVVSLGTPEYFKAEYLRDKAEAERLSKTKTKRGLKFQLECAEREKVKIKLSRQYWSEVERITQESGIDEAENASIAAQDALKAMVAAIMGEEEKTAIGLVIKAQALQAWGQVEEFYQVFNTDAPKWSQEITAAIFRQGTHKQT